MKYKSNGRLVCTIDELTVEFVQQQDIVKVWICTSDEEEEKLLALLKGLDLVFGEKTKSEDNVNSDFLTNMLEHNKALRLIGPGPLIPELLEKAAHFSLE